MSGMQLLPATNTGTKLSYVVIYPLGTMTLENGTEIDNCEIAKDALESLIMTGGISLPNHCGWEVHVINNDTGTITVIGKAE